MFENATLHVLDLVTFGLTDVLCVVMAALALSDLQAARTGYTSPQRFKNYITSAKRLFSRLVRGPPHHH
jgi:hypothetical protein